MIQIILFGCIGCAAMLIHWLSVCLLVSLGMVPLKANVIGFLIAFQWSYFGHKTWTFAQKHAPHGYTLPRFITTAVSGFLMNESLYFLLLRYSSMSYHIALIVVLITVAFFTFILNKFWVFNHDKTDHLVC